MTRIGHKKSRNGCSRCKERKVKCDERRPCGACIRFRLCCSLVQSPASKGGPPTGQVDPNPTHTRQRDADICRPSQSLLVSSHWLPIASRPRSQAVNPGSSFEQPPDWTADLGLMNHYTSFTSATLPGANLQVWQVEIPREAIAQSFLMHQILSVAAFHLASLNPSDGQAHLSRAFQHQHHAICGIKAEVAAITPSNCNAIFAASSLLFISAFAASAIVMDRGHQREVEDVLDVFTLIRGVNGIINWSKPVMRQGILREFMQCESYTRSTALLRQLLERLPRILETLDANSMDTEAKQLVEEAILSLGESIKRALTASPELNVAIVWPMTLRDGFLTLVRERHPAALVVVAHYCTVLNAVGSQFWFMRGCGYRLVLAVAESLGSTWHESIRWPMDYIKSSMASQGQGGLTSSNR
ncbi:hypothetical protein ACJZ2D_015912 [Fusarium nematophilum]